MAFDRLIGIPTELDDQPFQLPAGQTGALTFATAKQYWNREISTAGQNFLVIEALKNGQSDDNLAPEGLLDAPSIIEIDDAEYDISTLGRMPGQSNIVAQFGKSAAENRFPNIRAFCEFSFVSAAWLPGSSDAANLAARYWNEAARFVTGIVAAWDRQTYAGDSIGGSIFGLVTQDTIVFVPANAAEWTPGEPPPQQTGRFWILTGGQFGLGFPTETQKLLENRFRARTADLPNSLIAGEVFLQFSIPANMAILYLPSPLPAHVPRGAAVTFKSSLSMAHRIWAELLEYDTAENIANEDGDLETVQLSRWRIRKRQAITITPEDSLIDDDQQVWNIRGLDEDVGGNALIINCERTLA